MDKNNVDSKIEEMFERLFTLADSVKVNPMGQSIRENQPIIDLTVENDDFQIPNDNELSKIFDKMIQKVEKLIIRAKNPNKRFLEVLIASEKDQLKVTIPLRNIECVKMELYGLIHTMNTVKIYVSVIVKPNKRQDRIHKSRDVRRNRAKKIAKKWRELSNIMREYKYCDTLKSRSGSESKYYL